MPALQPQTEHRRAPQCKVIQPAWVRDRALITAVAMGPDDSMFGWADLQRLAVGVQNFRAGLTLRGRLGALAERWLCIFSRDVGC